MKGRSLPLFLSLIPPVFLLIWLFLYHVDCPVGDEWALAPLLQKSFEGSLTFHDFWIQHNEHRLIFPKIVLLLLARWTSWNITYELLANVLLGVGILLVLGYQVKRIDPETRRFLPILSFLVFSLNQSENWFSGWQIQIFMNVLAMILGMVLLSQRVTTWLRIMGAALLGIVASYSFASGMAYWLLGILVLLGVRARPEKVILWSVAAIAVLLSYFYQYHKPEHHPAISVVFHQPVAFLDYLLSYLGSPLLAFTRKLASVAPTGIPKELLLSGTKTPTIAGLFGLGIGICIPFKLLRDKVVSTEQILPFLSLMLYAFLTAAVSALGRAGFGTMSALSLRYVTISSLLWISNCVFLYLLAVQSKRFRKISVTILVSILFLISLNSVYGGLYARKQYYYLYPARQELYGLQNEELLKRLHHNPQTLRRYVEMMKKYRLSLFR